MKQYLVQWQNEDNIWQSYSSEICVVKAKRECVRLSKQKKGCVCRVLEKDHIILEICAAFSDKKYNKLNINSL